MIGPVNKGNLASIWAEASFKTALHSERTNANQFLTRSEAQAMAHNSSGPIQRITYQTPQVQPEPVGRHLATETPDLTKQNYSMLAQVQGTYHASDYTPFNYSALGQTAQLKDEAAAGIIVNRVV